MCLCECALICGCVWIYMCARVCVCVCVNKILPRDFANENKFGLLVVFKFLEYLYIFIRVHTCTHIQIYVYMHSYTHKHILGCPHGVVVKAMDCGIVVSEFVLQSRYYVHFRANTLGKVMNPLILPSMG